MFGQDRTGLRECIAVAWRKHLQRLPASPLEMQIAEVVAMHPEYHGLLGDADCVHKEFPVDAGLPNPFLHLAMHLSLREQQATDRPPGVRQVLKQMQRRLGDAHAAAHEAMECLGEALWRAQREGVAADEQAYLGALRRRLQGLPRRVGG